MHAWHACLMLLLSVCSLRVRRVGLPNISRFPGITEPQKWTWRDVCTGKFFPIKLFNYYNGSFWNLFYSTTINSFVQSWISANPVPLIPQDLIKWSENYWSNEPGSIDVVGQIILKNRADYARKRGMMLYLKIGKWWKGSTALIKPLPTHHPLPK
jgi:hypothetical protein